MQCLVVANRDDADAGFVGQRLGHHGFVLADAHREQPAQWPSAVEFDLVVLLGSEWSVYWDSVSMAVEAECALVRDAAHAGVPILGICYGMQILTHAFAGEVTRASQPEIGWWQIESDQPEIASGPWLQWHYDVCRVPEGFEILARSAIGPQVMQRGRILATQFHPEATTDIVSRWTRGDGMAELETLGQVVDDVMEATRRNVDTSRVHCNRLVDWFVESVAGT